MRSVNNGRRDATVFDPKQKTIYTPTVVHTTTEADSRKLMSELKFPIKHSNGAVTYESPFNDDELDESSVKEQYKDQIKIYKDPESKEWYISYNVDLPLNITGAKKQAAESLTNELDYLGNPKDVNQQAELQNIFYNKK